MAGWLQTEGRTDRCMEGRTDGRTDRTFGMSNQSKCISLYLQLPDEDDCTPLMIAILNNNPNLVRWLIDMVRHAYVDEDVRSKSLPSNPMS